MAAFRVGPGQVTLTFTASEFKGLVRLVTRDQVPVSKQSEDATKRALDSVLKAFMELTGREAGK